MSRARNIIVLCVCVCVERVDEKEERDDRKTRGEEASSSNSRLTSLFVALFIFRARKRSSLFFFSFAGRAAFHHPFRTRKTRKEKRASEPKME